MTDLLAGLLTITDGGSAPSSGRGPREKGRLVRLVETWFSLPMRIYRADWEVVGLSQRWSVLANIMNSDVFICVEKGRRTWWSLSSCKCPCTLPHTSTS